MSNRIPSLSDVVRQILNSMNGIERTLVEQIYEQETIDAMLKTIDEIIVHIDNIKSAIDAAQHEEFLNRATDIKQLIFNASELIKCKTVKKLSRLPNHSKRGNSYCNINGEVLKHLLSLSISVKEIARKGLLGGSVHPNTIYKYMKRNNIPSRNASFTVISDESLFEMVRELSDAFPNSGINEMRAFLLTKEPPVRVPIRRISELLKRVNSVGTSRRWTQVIKRRTYHVETPNSLWHIDTNHKLIRWSFIVGGGIDGYSRLITYLNVHDNNLALTSFNDFILGIKEYGVPSRVRADRGVEFVHIKKLMVYENGEDRGSFIEGRSVHNQRIERLWRDVHTKVLDKYRRVFYYMEEKGVLEIDNDIHLGVLHWVFLPRIQEDLNLWKKAHNAHVITTEGKTPLQLWHEGFAKNIDRESTAIENARQHDAHRLKERLEEFSLQNELSEPADIGIVLKKFPLPITENEKAVLERNVSVLGKSDSFGIDIFATTLRYVCDCIAR